MASEITKQQAQEWFNEFMQSHTIWINSPLLKWEVSILNFESTAWLQAQIDSLDSRVDDLENP